MMFSNAAHVTLDGKPLPDGFGITVCYRDQPRISIYQSQHWHKQGAKLVVWLTRKVTNHPGSGKPTSTFVRVREIEPERQVVITEAGKKVEIKDRQASLVQPVE